MAMIDFDGEVQVQVLSGLLGVSINLVYGLAKQRRFKHSGTYREAIRDYVEYWKSRANVRQTSLGQIAQVRKAELDRARLQQTWIAVRKERGELIDVNEFGEVLGRLFSSIRGQLLALARRYKGDVKTDVDIILEGWAKIGEVYLKDANAIIDEFEGKQLEELKKLEDFHVPLKDEEKKVNGQLREE